jgi:threonine dehydrogenase-like Zn-dependent dehydrogenase
MTLALELYRSVPRYVAARAVGQRIPGLISAPVAPLRLVNREEPALPAEGWTRVRPRLAGICGSDLATLTGRSSFYFTPLVSMPFIPGHEVVGELLDQVDDLPAGTRAVLDPVLSCAARGLEPTRPRERPARPRSTTGSTRRGCCKSTARQGSSVCAARCLPPSA